MNINDDIENIVNSCSVCQENSNSQQKESLLSEEVPKGPLMRIASDLFYFDGNNYLIVVDYFS
jgi:hypothetical protein